MKEKGNSIPQLPQTNALYPQAGWINKPVPYSKLNLIQLQEENQHILATLKSMEGKVSAELAIKKKTRGIYKNSTATNVEVFEQKIKNNNKLISALKHDIDLLEERRKTLEEGHESKVIDNKFNLERKINALKTEIKQTKLEQHETEKRLVKRGNPGQPQNYAQHQRMEEQLRAYSIRYVRLLDQYNKTTQKLAIASNTQMPQINVPEDIYDKELEEREETQFKEYQGIVKLCTVLSHRNDSEHNKAHRQYTQRLKDLQKIIMKLGQLDQAITTKEGQIVESKKNIQLLKVKMGSGQTINSRALRISQGSMSNPMVPRNKSYSSIRVKGMANEEETHQNKLRNRGYSVNKLRLAP